VSIVYKAEGKYLTEEETVAYNARMKEALNEVNDPVNHPPHYTAHPSGVECITVIEHMNLCLGSAVGYIWRCDLKGNPIEDLEKAIWYIRREIDRRKRLAEEA
jgi:hypothetical protein